MHAIEVSPLINGRIEAIGREKTISGKEIMKIDGLKCLLTLQANVGVKEKHCRDHQPFPNDILM
jgi:hypothetical protein